MRTSGVWIAFYSLRPLKPPRWYDVACGVTSPQYFRVTLPLDTKNGKRASKSEMGGGRLHPPDVEWEKLMAILVVLLIWFIAVQLNSSSSTANLPVFGHRINLPPKVNQPNDKQQKTKMKSNALLPYTNFIVPFLLLPILVANDAINVISNVFTWFPNYCILFFSTLSPVDTWLSLSRSLPFQCLYFFIFHIRNIIKYVNNVVAINFNVSNISCHNFVAITAAAAATGALLPTSLLWLRFEHFCEVNFCYDIKEK